jgi:prepilin-type N-terminal cleavage/methylation domain-containing protein
MTTRRGFTMVELMMAMVLTLMVGAVTYRILVTNQRVTRSQNERVGMQDNVRSGALIIGSELREVGYDRLPAALNVALAPYFGAGTVRSDIVAIGPDSVRYKAMRGFGVVCNKVLASNQLVLRASPAENLLQVTRPLAVGDSLMVYAEDTPMSSADDVWFHAGIIALPTAAVNCPDGTTGFRVNVQFSSSVVGTPVPTATAFGLITVGAPVRFFEEMVLRSYVANGDAWLGVRNLNTGTAIQPVLGPISNGLNATQGLTLVYRDANGAVTAVPANVRSMQVTLRGITDNPVHRNVQGYQRSVDTLAMTTHVALRNALR